MKCPNCKIECYFDGVKHACPNCPFCAAPNEKIITELYAYLSVDPETGLEGIIACMRDGPHGPMAMPMVNSDRKILEQCEDMIAGSGRPTRLVRFSNKTILKEIDP